ncbi:restriction endonuclease subunit S [Leuconostoc mesenteroides]|uniref:restriction endonuclease subunit S n=1 Tax=Leuconostoc mesenteroides TaxID=1245 RepID=UPI00385B636C
MNWRKKSKNDWGRLGLISNSWQKKTLSDFIYFKNGKKRPSITGDIPVYGGNGILDYTSESNLENAVIIGRVGAYAGSVYYESKKLWVSDNAIAAKAKDSSNIAFIYYLLKNLRLSERQIGTGQPLLTQNILNNIEVYLPSLEEQCKIAEILTTLDARIFENKKINHHLVELARSFWQERFSSKQPNGKLGDIIELFDSKRVPLSANQREKMDKTYPYYGATSLMDYVDDYLFDGTYLLLGEDGTVIDKEGYPILQYVWGKFWVNNHAHIMVGKNGFTVESLFVLLKNTCVSSIVTGAVQLKINQANLKSVDVYIPQKEELDNFNSTIEPIFDQLRNLYDEIKSLTTLRDALLPKLMSGEISVAD